MKWLGHARWSWPPGTFQRHVGGTRCLPSQAGSLFSYQKAIDVGNTAYEGQNIVVNGCKILTDVAV